MAESQLLCTFSTKQDFGILLQKINDNFILSNKCVYVLTTMTPYEVICTYNINNNPNTKYLPNTISVHRKKEVNCIYTVNSLNEITKNQKSSIVEWEKFRNCLLVMNDTGLRKISTKLFFVKRF